MYGYLAFMRTNIASLIWWSYSIQLLLYVSLFSSVAADDRPKLKSLHSDSWWINTCTTSWGSMSMEGYYLLCLRWQKICHLFPFLNPLSFWYALWWQLMTSLSCLLIRSVSTSITSDYTRGIWSERIIFVVGWGSPRTFAFLSFKSCFAGILWNFFLFCAVTTIDDEAELLVDTFCVSKHF